MYLVAYYYMNIIYSFFLVLFLFCCWVVGIVLISPVFVILHATYDCFCKLLLVQDS